MNRKAEGIAQLCEVSLMKAKAYFEAAGSFAKSLETIAFDEHNSMTLEEWGRYKDLADKVQSERHEFLRAIGALPPRPPGSGPLGAGLAGVRRVEEVGGHERKPGRRTARPAGSGRGEIVQEHGKGAADPVAGRQEKETEA